MQRALWNTNYMHFIYSIARNSLAHMMALFRAQKELIEEKYGVDTLLFIILYGEVITQTHMER